MTARAQHSRDAGFLAERTNPYVPGKVVVVYEAKEQGISVDDRLAVVCDAHGTTVSASTMVQARQTMKNPAGWCDGCRRLATQQERPRFRTSAEMLLDEEQVA